MTKKVWDWILVIAVVSSILRSWYYFEFDHADKATYWMAWSAVLILLGMMAEKKRER